MIDLQGRKVLVTGGAGFIGSHLADSLLKLGSRVVVYDSLDGFYPGKEKNVAANLANERYRFVEADVLDADKLRTTMRGVDVVFHLAGQAGVRYCNANPVRAEQVNATGTLNVLLAANEHKVKKVVAASSSSIFGNPVKPYLSEDHPLNPTNPYGVSKLAAEKYCLAFHTTYGTPVTCLRYFSVYGPRGRPDQVIHAFAEQIANGRRPVIYGDGKQSRDFTYVSDIVSGTVLAAMADESVGQVFNLGYGKDYSIFSVARMVIDAMGSNLEPELVEAYKGDFPKTLCLNTKARTLLRWSPQVGLEQGIPEFLQWFNKARATASSPLKRAS